MPIVDKPKVNSLSASMATLHDFMPRNAVELAAPPGFRPDLYARSFACVKHQRRQLLDTSPYQDRLSVISIDQHGILFYHTSEHDSKDNWNEERFEVAELRGSKILRILAIDLQEDQVGICALVVALDSSGQPQIVVLIRKMGNKDWKIVKPSEGTKIDVNRFVDSYVGGLYTPYGIVLYASPQRGGDGCGLMWITPSQVGVALPILDSSSKEVKHKNSHFIQTKSPFPVYVYVENNTIFTSESTPYIRGPEDSYIDLSNAKSKTISTKLKDGVGQIVPITDVFGLCRGLLIFDGDGRALHCAMDRDGNITSETSLNVDGGPERIRELACVYSISESSRMTGDLNVFARDERDMVWHVAWRAFDQDSGKPTYDAPEQAAHDIRWQATGHRAVNLDVVSEIRTMPFVFAGKRMGGVERLSQIKGGDWVSTKIAAGLRFDETAEALVHAIQISAVTVLSHPVPGTELDVRADKTILVEHEGEFFHLGPDRPTILKTGPSGGLRLKMRAEDNLEAPTLTVTHKDLPQAFRYHPQDGALRRLAGLAPDPGPNPGFEMTVERLKKENLLPPVMGDKVAEEFVTRVKNLAASALVKNADMAPGNRLALRRLGIEEEVSISFTMSREPDGFSIRSATPADPGWPGVDPQNSLWSDLWAWVSKGWEAVKNMTATVVGTVVHFAVKIGETIKTFVADTARRIGEVITSFFQWISAEGAEAAKKLVSFLAERLGWDDVIRVKDLTRLYTLRFLTDLETVVGHSLPNLVSSRIAKARDLVEKKFDEVIDKLDPAPKASLQPYEADRQKLHDNGAKTFAVQDSIPVRPVERALFEPSDQLKQRVQKLTENFSNVKYKNLIADTIKKLESVLTEDMSPDKLLLVLTSVLKLLKPFVSAGFDAIDVVQTAIFEFAADMIKLVRKAMTTPITMLGSSFNWINTFYKGLSGGKDLDLLDLGCLLFVAPGVMFHHLLKNSPLMASAPKEEEVETVLSTLPQILNRYARGNGPDAPPAEAANDDPEPNLISPVFKKFFEKYRIILLQVRAIYRFASIGLVIYSNSLKDLRTLGSPTNDTLDMVFSIAEKLMLGIVLTETAFVSMSRITSNVEKLAAKISKPEVYIFSAVSIILVCVLGLAAVFSKIGKISLSYGPVGDIITAAIANVVATCSVVYLIVNAIWFSEPETDEAKARDARLSLAGMLIAIVRGYIQFGIPVGGMLARVPEGVIASVGMTLKSIQQLGDPTLVFADGIILEFRAGAV